MRGLIFGIAIGIAVAGSGAVAPGADAQVAEPEVSITGFAYPFTGAQVCPDEPGYPAPSQMTPGSVTLTRTGSTADPLNVSYAVDGSAATPCGIATFAAGSATATFAVAPTVRTKLFISLGTPRFSSETRNAVGRVALDDEVENAVTMTSQTRLKKSIGFIFDSSQIESE